MPSSTARARLTEGPVAKHLTAMTVPMMGGLFAIISQGLVDSYFVKALGTEALAALSYVFPVSFVLTSVSIGLGVGTSSVVARLIGRGDIDNVRLTATHGILLAVLVVGMLALIGVFTVEPLFRLLGAEGKTLAFVISYMNIWYGGVIFIVLPMVGNAVIRATGDAVLPSLIMVAVALANVILDPLLINGWGPIPAMGMEGAAYATVGANLTGAIASLYIVGAREGLLDLRIPTMPALLKNWHEVMRIGLPAAFANMITPAGNIVVVTIVSLFGTAAVAGFGVAIRIESIALIVPFAMSAIIGPFVGQNFGANRVDRMRLAMSQLMTFSLAYAAFMAFILAVFGEVLAGVFIENDPVAVQAAVAYLWFVPITYAGHSVLMIVAGAFNALGDPKPNITLYVSRMLLLYVPVAFLGSRYFGLDGVYGAAVLANTVGGIAAFIWYRLRFPQIGEGETAPAE